MKVELKNVIVDAYSVGGTQTCIQLPGFKLAFDMGFCPNDAHKIPTVFFTHGHIDHMGAIITHCIRRNVRKMGQTNYFVPEFYYDDVLKLFDAWRQLDRGNLECNISPLKIDDSVHVGKGRRVVPFRARHVIPTYGYAVVENKKRLAKGYQGKTGKELGALRKRGAILDEEYEHVHVAFCGDTDFYVTNEPHVQNASLLILECTFMGDSATPDEATDWGHNHLDHIVNNLDKFENNGHVLLTHFSGRYLPYEIRDEVYRKMTPEMSGKFSFLYPDGTVETFVQL